MYRTTYRSETTGRTCGIVYAMTLAATVGAERIARHLANAIGEPVVYRTEPWTPVK